MANLKYDSFTPEYIQSKLFYFHDVAHKFHLDTTSFAEHKALDELYKGMVEFKDEISELIMGYQNGKRIGRLRLEDIPDYSHSEVIKLADGIKMFGVELEKWAEDKKYCDVSNTAQALSGLGAKTYYLLTLV